MKEMVKAKVEKSKAIGAKATWGYAEQHRFAARVVLKVMTEEGAMDPTEEQLADLLASVTNASATAQRLEKAFKGTGHFERVARAKPTAEGFLAEIVAEAGKVA